MRCDQLCKAYSGPVISRYTPDFGRISHRSSPRPERTKGDDQRELLQLAFIKIAAGARLLAMAGEELLAEEAEALAEKVDLAEAAART
jgi:hypothetical protein